MIVKVLFMIFIVQQTHQTVYMTLDVNNPAAGSNKDSSGYLTYEFHKPEEDVSTWVGRLTFTAELKVYHPDYENNLPKSFTVQVNEENAMSGNLDNYMKAKIADPDNAPDIPIKGIVVLQVNLDSEGSYIFVESDTFSWATGQDFDKGWIQDALNQSKAGPTILTDDEPEVYAKFVENYKDLILYHNESDYKKKRESFMEDVDGILPDLHEHPSKYITVYDNAKIDVETYPVANYIDGNTQSIERVDQEIVVFRIKVHMLEDKRVII